MYSVFLNKAKFLPQKIKNFAVFFHPVEQIEVVSGKFNMVTMEAEFTRLESELSFLQVRATMTLQETIRQVKAEICEDRKQADCSHEAGEHHRGGESLQSHAGVRERTSGHLQWGDRVRDQVSGDGHAPKDTPTASMRFHRFSTERMCLLIRSDL